MKKTSFLYKTNLDSDFFLKMEPSSFSERKYKYLNCGPRIQINPRRKYYGLELKNTIYSSPKIYMQNYNKFKHNYITEISKSKFHPQIKLNFFQTQKNKNESNFIEKNNFKIYKIKCVSNNNATKNSSIEIQTFENNNKDIRKRNNHFLRKINLKFPYTQPIKTNLDDFFLKIKKKKNIH